MNSQENEGEQSSHDNHGYEHGREDGWDDDNCECDHERKLHERVHVEGKHSVHLLLIFSEAVEDTACRCRVEETHGTVNDLRKGKKKKKNLIYLWWVNIIIFY